jgi:hypothetical protein
MNFLRIHGLAFAIRKIGHSFPRHLLQAQTPCTGSELHGRCVVI